MKIDNQHVASINQINAIRPVERTEKKTAASNTDHVSVSDKAQVFNELLQKAKALPSVREERVQELRDQIGSGKYEIQAARIAAKMIIQPVNAE
ncbi:MAG: flagellar biosynthesis anti-sigma factor FlgM [Peptococcaceae bacterium]|jgi:negative regulator of flagellin synthesis FlgM|nr:flagellar biosynthesis anti-sigma factor FlgM [Peptococcaceae bacterium]